MSGQAIRDEKVKVLRAIQPLTAQQVATDTVRGQYGPGKDVPAYRQEEGVDPQSLTETYAALKLHVDTWRWSGVPFYLRTGKRLAAKASQIVVVFRREPVSLFYDARCDVRSPNRLAIRIFPHEGISLACDAKVPGPRMLLRPVKMDFRYNASFESASPEAYEHLVLDAMQGETSLFIRNDEVEAAWRFVDSIRSAWDVAGLPELVQYAPGTWGPPQAQALLADPYRDWQAVLNVV
jgi:glucose-6-phosphate 1-dehydrogenase